MAGFPDGGCSLSMCSGGKAARVRWWRQRGVHTQIKCKKCASETETTAPHTECLGPYEKIACLIRLFGKKWEFLIDEHHLVSRALPEILGEYVATIAI